MMIPSKYSTRHGSWFVVPFSVYILYLFGFYYCYRPVYVHLMFENHVAACSAYDKLTDYSATSKEPYPIKVHWYKNQFYYQVANKAKQMEYNVERVVDRNGGDLYNTLFKQPK